MKITADPNYPERRQALIECQGSLHRSAVVPKIELVRYMDTEQTRRRATGPGRKFKLRTGGWRGAKTADRGGSGGPCAARSYLRPAETLYRYISFDFSSSSNPSGVSRLGANLINNDAPRPAAHVRALTLDYSPPALAALSAGVDQPGEE